MRSCFALILNGHARRHGLVSDSRSHFHFLASFGYPSQHKKNDDLESMPALVYYFDAADIELTTDAIIDNFVSYEEGVEAGFATALPEEIAEKMEMTNRTGDPSVDVQADAELIAVRHHSALRRGERSSNRY